MKPLLLYIQAMFNVSNNKLESSLKNIFGRLYYFGWVLGGLGNVAQY